MSMERPPLGLVPKELSPNRGKARLAEIENAVERYENANKSIPINWMVEYIEVLRNISPFNRLENVKWLEDFIERDKERESFETSNFEEWVEE